MRGQGKFLSGILIGLGLAFLLDPDRGAGRRARVRDQAASAGRRLADNLDATARDLRNRARGTAAELGAKFRRDDVDDETLRERVRSAIGRVVSHPSAIDVDVVDRLVTLRGPVLADEAHDLIATARGVRGVSDVIDQTSVHSTPDGVTALQGKATRQSG
jgi:osmotically-inducible protein OsmY